MIRAVIFDMYETLITVFDVPPYYSAAMAADAGVTAEQFREYWRGYEHSRSVGACTLTDAVAGTLRCLGVYRDDLVRTITEKRLADQRRIYACIRPEIIAMLDRLKQRGIGIGLISNCYPEERDCIRASRLAPYFDAMLLSCEQGIVKPDPEIFTRCLDALKLSACETFYVGDGGSMELEQAAACGMTPVQACWFLRGDEPEQPCTRKEGFLHAEHPDEISELVLSGGRADRNGRRTE